MDLSVIIPAYNERESIAACLIRVAAAMPDLDKELIIIDDCSSDGTREWLRDNVDGLTGTSCALDVTDNGGLKIVDGAAKGLSIKLYRIQLNMDVLQ